MKRLAIFVFYDFQGVVDDYVEYLLAELAKVVSEIVVISNGNLSEGAKKILGEYSNKLFERSNIGFDAGAYKDAFMLFLKNENWQNWDEIILLNDTFYGPIYPFECLFKKMDKQDVDFWGLTKFENGKWEDDERISCHLQGYFLAIRKTMLCSDKFYKFWEEMKYPKVLKDAIRDYEVKFTDLFSKLGFRFMAYTDIEENGYIKNFEDNVYFIYTFELIAKSKVPIVKRNSLYLINYMNAKKTINYIENNTLYDVGMIKKHIKRLDSQNQVKPFGFKNIFEFCSLFSKIYIYGNGKYGHEIKRYMDDKNLKVEKFIVTKKEQNNNEVISLDELAIDRETGIILAMGEKHTKQVCALLETIIPKQQLLIPMY